MWTIVSAGLLLVGTVCCSSITATTENHRQMTASRARVGQFSAEHFVASRISAVPAMPEANTLVNLLHRHVLDLKRAESRHYDRLLNDYHQAATHLMTDRSLGYFAIECATPHLDCYENGLRPCFTSYEDTCCSLEHLVVQHNVSV